MARKRDGFGRKPRRNPVPCAVAKAHAMGGGPRYWGVGLDGRVHVRGAENALCGAEFGTPKVVGTFQYCSECTEVLQEIERMTA